MEEPVFPRYLSDMGPNYPRLRPASTGLGSQHDLLLEADYNHVMPEATCVQCSGRSSGQPARTQRQHIRNSLRTDRGRQSGDEGRSDMRVAALAGGGRTDGQPSMPRSRLLRRGNRSLSSCLANSR
jgi:hypothetical protein